MNASTEQSRSVYRSGAFLFFSASIALLVIVLIIVFVPLRNFLPFLPGSRGAVYRGWFDWLQHFGPYSAGWLTMENAIAEFQAQPPVAVDWSMMAGVLATLLLTFVLAPVTYLFLSERMRKMELFHKKLIRFIMKSAVIVSAVWCLLIAGTMIASLWGRSFSLGDEMRKEVAMQSYRNSVSDRLMQIAYTAQQRFILPADQNGGGMSFFRNGRKMSLTDLGFSDTSSLGQFVMLQGDCDTALQILCVGNQLATQHRWSGETKGRVVEYKLTIYPQTMRLEKVY